MIAPVVAANRATRVGRNLEASPIATPIRATCARVSAMSERRRSTTNVPQDRRQDADQDPAGQGAKHELVLQDGGHSYRC